MDDYTTTARLQADVGQFIAGFKSAAAEYKNFNDTMRTSSLGSTDALSKSSSVISSAMKLSAVAVVGLGVASVKTGMDFEAQMSRVGAISGATKGQLKEMNNQAIDLGAKTAFSAKEAAEGMENLSSAGFTANETMTAIPGVLDLAAVSGGNVGEAAENAATALRGFGLDAGDAGHVADVFAKAAAETNAEASDMGEALKMVAPQAHAAGLSLEETSAAIGILSDAGIKGSMAGSNLGMALTKVQNPSDEAKDSMEKLGFSAYDSAGKMKPLGTQVSELRDKMSGMKDEQKQATLAQIYGVQGGRAMNVLLSAQKGKLEELTGSLKNSNGAAKSMAEQMQDNLKSSVEQFGGALESLSIVVEQTFSGSLRNGVDSATDAIGRLTEYIQSNQGAIQDFTAGVTNGMGKLISYAPSMEQVGSALKVILPSLVAIEAFKGIGVAGAKTVQALETMQADLTLVATGANMTQTAIGKMGSFTVGVYGKVGSAVKGALKSVNSFNNTISGAGAYDALKNSLASVGTGFTNLKSKSAAAGSALVANLKNPKVAFENLGRSAASGSQSINTALYGLLSTVGATDAQLAALTNTAMKNGTAIGTVGKGMEGITPAMMQGGVAAGGLGASLGVLIPIALAVAAVAAALYAAWDTNMLNIRGVVETAWNGIKGIFDSMSPAIDGVKTSLAPIGTLIKNIFAIVGVGIITAIVSAVIILATALRLVVDALSAIAKVGASAGNMLKAVGLAATGHFKEAGKAISDAKKDMGQAGDAVKDMGTAFKDAWTTGKDAFSQFEAGASTTKKSTDIAKVSVKEVGSAAKQMKSDLESSKADFSELINTDGVSDKTKQFLTDVNNTLDQYQKNAETASDKYQKSMSSAEQKTGDARLNAINTANAKLASATQKNGQNLINVSGDLDRQLQAKRFSDGTAMTADQVKILTDQNNKIKAKLLEQNQVYVQAQMSRLQNGQKLNQQEQQATVTTIQSNYQLRAQQITQGEQKVTALKAQIKATQDTTTKAQLQQELAQTTQHNTQLLQQQTVFGTQMNLAIANGSKLNFQTWSAGLQQMNNVTAPQLQSMYLSFVQMNGSTSQQMQAFALMLQRSGTQGVNNLVQALSTGKATTAQVAAAIAKDGTDGLNTLPPGMFKKGDSGKNSFIQALKSGDFAGAGKYLATESAKGADQKSKHEKSGKDNNKSYSDGVKSGKGAAKTAGETVAKSGATGAKNKKSDYKSAGSSNGKSYNSGVKSQKGEASAAGKSLASSAKSGAKGVSFNSVGSQMAAGVAAGIRSNTGAAVAAMASLVAQVNAQAKKAAKIHSPSRLMRDEVGKFLSLGVAEGIQNYAGTAADAMALMISDLGNQTVDTSRLNASIASIASAGNVAIQGVGATLNSNVTVRNPQADETNQLLRQLIAKEGYVMLDTGELVGRTTNKYDQALGQNAVNNERWD